MGSILWTTYLILSVLALIQALLVVVQTWEHHRHAKGRLRAIPLCPVKGRAVVVVPCRGIDIGLTRNLATLMRQDYGNYLVRFVVESLADPACGVIYHLMLAYPEVASELVVAGHAEDDGQKIHNLAGGHRGFATPDRIPCLRRFRCPVGPALAPGAGLPAGSSQVGTATGYRWFLPKRASLANFVLYSINACIAVFLGKHSPTIVWGGSLGDPPRPVRVAADSRGVARDFERRPGGQPGDSSRGARGGFRACLHRRPPRRT